MPTASNVAFVADSTLGLSPEEALSQGIHVVPQQVIWKDKTFRDQLEITDEKVLDLLRQGERLSTSQVAPDDLRTTYPTLVQSHARVLSVHVSGHLSGTVATAMAVAREFGEQV
ncbi:MAG: DegV family protein, partial [Thermus sp.]